jgi:hypothetical protein
MSGNIEYVFGSPERDMVLPVAFAVMFPIARALLNRLIYEVRARGRGRCLPPVATPRLPRRPP